jgi:cell division transport system ATP-binding protein
MIRLHRVSKVYEVGAVRIPALTDISFRLHKAEFAVLSGPSGAGKTTLLRLLYREEQATEGDIEVGGFPVTDLRSREVPVLRRAMGVVFQDARLLPGRTVFENVAFVLRVLGAPRREVGPSAHAALKAVGLSARAQAYPAQLSQGEAQRASLARAIVGSPPVLLADEPTGNLDEAMASEIVELLKDVWNRGTTVLLATHQGALCAQLKRRTLTLAAGRLVKDEG